MKLQFQPVRRRLAAGAVLLLHAGCGDAGDPPDALRPAAVLVEPDLRIGSIDGGGPAVFGRIGGIAVDAAGRIIVADALAHELRVFDAAGGHIFSFGRQGAGPGEFSSPCCLAFDADSLLWIRDGGNGRYNAFRVGDDHAAYVTSMRMNHSDVNRWVTLTFDAAGHLIDIGSRVRPDGSGPATYRFHRAADGAVAREVPLPDPPGNAVPVHTVQRQLAGGTATLYLNQPFGPRHIMAHGPAGAFADAVTSAYEVRVHGSNGALAHTIRRSDVEAPALSADERERAAAALDREAARAQMAVGDLPFGVPARKPPLRHLEFDRDGNLWVFLEPVDGAARRADVFDHTGALVRSVEWSDRLDTFPLLLQPDALYGVVRDSLDVQYVTRLRLP